MNNNPVDEADVVSDEIKGEIYSITERLIILIVIFIIGLILCIIYLCRRIDIKQFSCLYFFICLIYSSMFIMLNVITMFDLVYSNEVRMTKFLDMISIYYKIFN